MSIGFYDFQNLHNEEFRGEIKDIFNHIIDTNAFIEGEYNDKFETEFARLQGAKHCLLVANGTDALEISLKVSGVKPGDHVGIPGITFYATAEAAINIGAIPVWIDVHPETGLICPESLKRVHQQTQLKAIMPVHIYGLPAPIKELQVFCEEQSICIIEDAAQAQGTLLEDQPVGSTPNLVTFSFYPTKNLSAFGDAGCILTQSDAMAEKIKVERNHGRGDEMSMGRNSRCDHLQAAVLYTKLKNVEAYNQNRKNIAHKYHQALENSPVKTLPSKYLTQSSWHLYPTQCESVEQRIKLQKLLQENQIGCTPFYEKALSQEPALQQYSGESENAKAFAGKTLCLPIHPFLKDEDIQKIAETLKNS